MYKPDQGRAKAFWTTLQEVWLKLYGSFYPTAAAINVRKIIFYILGNFSCSASHQLSAYISEQSGSPLLFPGPKSPLAALSMTRQWGVGSNSSFIVPVRQVLKTPDM